MQALAASRFIEGIMDNMDFLKETELIKNILLLLGALFTVYKLDAWRKEHVIKRQVELAEDTLALFYESVDAIKYIRFPISYTNEMEHVIREDDEPLGHYTARRRASGVFFRYEKHQELFNKLHASRYRFMAQIGKNKAQPFIDLRNINNRILNSARGLSVLWARNDFISDDENEKHLEKVIKHEHIIWDGFEDDIINKELERIIAAIEETCNAVISGKGTLYGILNAKPRSQE